MINQLKLFFFITSLQIAVPSCGNSLEIVSIDELFNVEWELKSFETVDGNVVDVEPDQEYTIHFDSDSTVLGQADCNDYSANYTVTNNDSLSIEKIINTEAACSFESRWMEFLEALDDASSFKIRESELRIFYNNREKVLNFTKE